MFRCEGVSESVCDGYTLFIKKLAFKNFNNFTKSIKYISIKTNLFLIKDLNQVHFLGLLRII